MLDDEKGQRLRSRSLIDRALGPRKEQRIAQADPNGLDSPAAQELWRRCMAFYVHELERHRDNRIEQAEDCAFYDGEQWSSEEKAIIEERGQEAVVYNVVANTVDWILGTEKVTRTDYRILPKAKEFGPAAEAKTDTFKYLSDVNHTRFVRSRAFKDAVVAGVGWMQDAVTNDCSGELIDCDWVSWRAMHWDSRSMQADLNRDARYLTRSQWCDIDMACAWFPKRKKAIELAAQNMTEFGAFDWQHGDEPMDEQEELASLHSGIVPAEMGYYRDRVRLVEMEFKRPVPEIPWMKGGQFHGEVYDPYSRGHREALEAEDSEIFRRPGLRTYVMIFTTAGPLWLGESPYRHNRFSYTPIWAYRRDKDNMPYGPVRRLKSIQKKINYSNVKATAILASNKVVMDEGAVEDLDEFQEEWSRPDAVAVVKPGARFEPNVDRNLAAAYDAMMARDISMIQQTGGVTDENRGLTTNAKSGIAIERRQEQGAVTTSGLFDNLLFARLQQGEKQLSLIEQFMEEPRQIHVVNERGKVSFRSINTPGVDVDDITRSKATFTISEDEFRATIRERRSEQLLGIVERLVGAGAGNVALVMLDLVVDSMDIPNREEIVGRIRKLTGAPDPDATEPTPEELAAAAKAAEQEERIRRLEEATIAEKEASAAQKGATAAKTAAGVARENVGAQSDAMQAALAVVTAPQVAPVGDRILHEAGFKGRTEHEADAEVDQRAAELEQLAAEGAAMQEQAAAEQQQPPALPAPPNPEGA